jgi:hypothetical protein
MTPELEYTPPWIRPVTFAIWDFIARVIGLVLLAAGALKGYDFATGSHAPTLVASGWQILGLAGFEFLLGLWLLCGWHRRFTRPLALVTLTFFFGVAANQALAGRTDMWLFRQRSATAVGRCGL